MNRKLGGMMDRIRIFALCLTLSGSLAVARGERRLDIGNQYDFSFGGTNYSGIASTQLQEGIAPFFGFYPALSMRFTGQQSVFNVSYRALLERFNGDQKINSLGHVLNSGFAVNGGSRLKLNFTGSFSSAPDYTLVQVLEGVPAVPDSNFVYQPTVGKSSMKTFRGQAAARYDLSYRSYLAFDYSGMALDHGRTSELTAFYVDQRRRQGRVGFWYGLSPYQSVDLQYAHIVNNYGEFGRGTTQSAVVGIRRKFSPALEAHVQAGPAYVTYDNVPSFFGYALFASVARKIGSSNIAGFYSHTPGDSSGLGTLSNMHSGGISIFTPLWRRMGLATNISAFTSRGVVDDLYRYRGFYGTVDISYPLSRRWFVTWGGSYRSNVQEPATRQEYKRLFMSIRFRAPELWRTSL